MTKFRHIPSAGIVDGGAVSVESEWNPKNPGILHIRRSRILPAALSNLAGEVIHLLKDNCRFGHEGGPRFIKLEIRH